jgi:hypothetical protein
MPSNSAAMSASEQIGADPAGLARGERMVAVVARLGRQIERDRQAGLAAREIGAIQRVAGRRRAVSRVGAEQPWLIALRGRRRTALGIAGGQGSSPEGSSHSAPD